MTGLVRKAVLLATGCVFIASVAVAGVPTWTNSIQPSAIKLGGVTGATGQPSSASAYTIKDGNGVNVANTRVKLDFTSCTGIYLCATQDAGITKVGSTIEGTTDGLGVVTFRVRGGALGGAGYSGTCVAVTLPDNPAAGNGTAKVAAAFDLNGGGAPFVDASDLSVWGTDANNCAGGTHRGRSDYTGNGACPGGIDASDLSAWGAAANEGPAACTP